MDADKHLTARAGPQQVSGPFDLAAPGTAGHSVLPWGREAKGSHSGLRDVICRFLSFSGLGPPTRWLCRPRPGGEGHAGHCGAR